MGQSTRPPVDVMALSGMMAVVQQAYVRWTNTAPDIRDYADASEKVERLAWALIDHLDGADAKAVLGDTEALACLLIQLWHQLVLDQAGIRR